MAIMGGGDSFSPAGRVEAVWLSTTEQGTGNGALSLDSEFDAPKLVTLRALSLSMSSEPGVYSVVLMSCPACRTSGADIDDGNWLTDTASIGGHVVVGYRGPQGYDTRLAAHHQSTVQIQVLKKRSSASAGSGSDLRATLRAGESFYVPYRGLAVAVCSIGPEAASVGFAYSTARSSALASALGLCSFSSPPPPGGTASSLSNACSSSTANCDTIVLSADPPFGSSVYSDGFFGPRFRRSNSYPGRLVWEMQRMNGPNLVTYFVRKNIAPQTLNPQRKKPSATVRTVAD